MRRQEIPGIALVDFIVDAKGDVRNARALKADHASFAAAAVQCVAAWKYSPGMKNGQPVNTHIQMPIVFSVNRGR